MHAVLKTAQILFQLARRLRRKTIDHPVLMTVRFHQPLLFQIRKMLGNLDLRLIEKGLEMAHAQRARREKVQNPQAGLVAKALVNLDQFNGAIISGRNIPARVYYSRRALSPVCRLRVICLAYLVSNLAT